MRSAFELEQEIDRIVGELDRVDKALDGVVDDHGEMQDGALDMLARAEDAWVEHKDAQVSILARKYDGRQLPGDDKINALTREASEDARRAWGTYLHARRLVRRLKERADRLQNQLSGRQTQTRIINAELLAGERQTGGDGRGLPQGARQRGARFGRAETST